MDTEYEATFPNINKDDVRRRLKAAGAQLIKPQFLQKRVAFFLPRGHEIRGGWVRVRDESDKITMSFKVVTGGKIENQKEICLEVDNFEKAVALLEVIGCVKKSYQENYRELWTLDGANITIDEWPFLEPLVEIEGTSEEVVQAVAQKLGFDYKEAVFDSTGFLIAQKYGISEDDVNNNTPLITFSGENPYLVHKKASS